MKKLLTLTSILCAVATLTFVTGCASTGTTAAAASPQKETLLQQAGFKTLTVTTPKQKQQVEALTLGRVSAVKYKGKLFYVYPTAQKDHIYYGKQAQYNASSPEFTYSSQREITRTYRAQPVEELA